LILMLMMLIRHAIRIDYAAKIDTYAADTRLQMPIAEVY